MEKLPSLDNVEKEESSDLSVTELQAIGNKILSGVEEAEHQGAFEDLAERISKTGTEAYEVLNATDPHAYTEFVENPGMRLPRNERGKLHREEIVDKLTSLDNLESKLKAGLESGEYSDKQRLVLEAALNSNKLENGFVMACILYNEDPTEKNAILHRRANKALYGEPDRDVFLALLNEQLSDIESRDLSLEDQQEFRDLKTIIGPLEPAKKERYRPSQETIDRFSEMAEDYFAPLFEYIPEDKEEFSIQEAADITEEILRDVVPDDSEWHAVVDPSRRAAAVSQQDKKIYFPGERAKPTYSRKALKKIIVHELGTHAMRSIPFENHSVGNLRTGLPNYEGFEEGVAKVLEQAVDRKYQDAGIRHYISIGLVNFMGKDFRDAYEIQKRLNHLTGTGSSDKIVYNSVQRALRGTDVLPNNKDLVYYNGNTEVWQFIEQNLDDPELFDKLFLSAKTNITDSDHERIAYEARVGGI